MPHGLHDRHLQRVPVPAGLRGDPGDTHLQVGRELAGLNLRPGGALQREQVLGDVREPDPCAAAGTFSRRRSAALGDGLPSLCAVPGICPQALRGPLTGMSDHEQEQVHGQEQAAPRRCEIFQFLARAEQKLVTRPTPKSAKARGKFLLTKKKGSTKAWRSGPLNRTR